MVHHISLFSELAGSRISKPVAGGRITNLEPGMGGDWLGFDQNSFAAGQGGTIVAVEGNEAAEFSVALSASTLNYAGGVVAWEWEASVVKPEGEGVGDAPWCGVGVSDLKGSGGGGWFYHSRGYLASGDMLEDSG